MDRDCVRGHYDSFPQEYQEIEGDASSSLQCRSFDYFLAQWQTGMPVVDVGCGTGRVGRYAAECLKPETVTYSDLSFQSLRIARALHGSRDELSEVSALFAQVDVEVLPFQNLRFAMCHGVVHHTPNPHKALDSLLAAMAPGGVLYLTVYGNSWYRHVYALTSFLRETRKKGMRWPVELAYGLYYPLRWGMRVRETGRIDATLNMRARFEDFIMTPYAHFFEQSELVEAFDRHGMRVQFFETLNMGVLRAFVLKKAGAE